MKFPGLLSAGLLIATAVQGAPEIEADQPFQLTVLSERLMLRALPDPLPLEREKAARRALEAADPNSGDSRLALAELNAAFRKEAVSLGQSFILALSRWVIRQGGIISDQLVLEIGVGVVDQQEHLQLRRKTTGAAITILVVSPQFGLVAKRPGVDVYIRGVLREPGLGGGDTEARLLSHWPAAVPEGGDYPTTETLRDIAMRSATEFAEVVLALHRDRAPRLAEGRKILLRENKDWLVIAEEGAQL